jgi:chloramphenicol 3-O-phosphotransferase
MKITYEITDFEGLQDILDDLVIDTPVEEFFFMLPTHVQLLAIAYGCEDEEFQEEVYDFLLDEDYDND